MILSILSEIEPIQQWLDTPEGYYQVLPTYGNNLYVLLFKNTKTVKSKLNLIVDKIRIDLGYEIASTIQNIELLATEELDKHFIVIYYTSGIATTEVKV